MDHSAGDFLFQISGMSGVTVDGQLALMYPNKEIFRSSLEYVDGRCSVNGFDARVFVSIHQIEEMVVFADNKKTMISSLRVSGSKSVEFSDLANVVWWYDARNIFNTSETAVEFGLKTGAVLAKIKLSEVRAFTTEGGNKTTIALANGESHLGQIVSAPGAIVGELADQYHGFQATAFFVLDKIASMRAAT